MIFLKREICHLADGSSSHSTADIWLLLGHKAGDNSQVLALAEALDQRFECMHFHYASYELLTNLLLRATLAGVDRARSSPLNPPWPRLVITAGRRNEPIARWIQRQSDGVTRIVHIGRPWASLDAFDLIITTPQYNLPQRDNILHLQLPLHRLSHSKLQTAAATWRARLAVLPRPYTALLIGGNSGRFVFTPELGRRLGTLANNYVRQCGGSLLVTDSPRTPPEMFAALEKQLSVPAFVHRCGSGADNPYLALLGLADQLIVTGESMSMLAEACSTEKPVFIFDPASPDPRWWLQRYNFHHKPLSHHLLMRFGPRRMRRDVGRIQRALVAAGHAAWLGDQTATEPLQPPADEMHSAVRRVRKLLEQSCHSGAT